MFISHTGEVYPCASLPVTGGNVRVHELADIYRSSQVFTLLRDAGNLTGKCGDCGFKQICGGSRARSYAMNADMFREDPSCIYRPLAPVAETGILPNFAGRECCRRRTVRLRQPQPDQAGPRSASCLRHGACVFSCMSFHIWRMKTMP